MRMTIFCLIAGRMSRGAGAASHVAVRPAAVSGGRGSGRGAPLGRPGGLHDGTGASTGGPLTRSPVGFGFERVYL